MRAQFGAKVSAEEIIALLSYGKRIMLYLVV